MISIREYRNDCLVSETAAEVDGFLMATIYEDFMRYTRKGFKVKRQKVSEDTYRVSWYDRGLPSHVDITEIE